MTVVVRIIINVIIKFVVVVVRIYIAPARGCRAMVHDMFMRGVLISNPLVTSSSARGSQVLTRRVFLRVSLWVLAF